MSILFRLAVYACSVWVSNKYAGGYWVVGPVFGLAVVSFDLKSFKDIDLFKHTAFVALSTLIYALVYRVSRLEWGTDTDVFRYFIGSFSAAIVLGSVLMAVLHTLLFSKSKECMASAMLRLVGSYYLLSILMYINDKSHLGWDIQGLTLMIAAWQGLYLFTFFARSKRG